MNKKQRNTLTEVFQTPVPASLEWASIESLFTAHGAGFIKGRSSRALFELNGVVVAFHLPHPGKEAKQYQVRDARSFLGQAGIKP